MNYEVEPPEGICHWHIDLEDDESADLLHQLPTAVTWLERCMRQKGSKVLVHCNAGGVSKKQCCETLLGLLGCPWLHPFCIPTSEVALWRSSSAEAGQNQSTRRLAALAH